MITKLLKNSIFKLLIISLVMLLITMPFVWLQISHPQQFHSITSIIAQDAPLFVVFRWILIVILIGGWPYFIRSNAKKYAWNSEKTYFWLAQRLRLSTWLIIFELLICQNILLILIKAL